MAFHPDDNLHFLKGVRLLGSDFRFPQGADDLFHVRHPFLADRVGHQIGRDVDGTQGSLLI